MPSIHPKGARLGAALLTTGLVLTGAGLGASSASAAEPTAQPAAEPAAEPTGGPNQAPVPSDDRVTLRGQEIKVVDVLANDSDPDGDDLQLCRVSIGRAPVYAEVVSGDDDVFVLAGRGTHRPDTRLRVAPAERQQLVVFSQRNRAGTYSIRYGVCDREQVRFATVTVRVLAVPELRARTVPGRPGVVQFSNPSDRKYVVQYFEGGLFDDDEPTKVPVLAHDRVRIRTTAPRIDYLAYQPRGNGFVDGTVRGIQRSRSVAARSTSTRTP